MSLTGQGVLQMLGDHRAPNEKGQKRSQMHFFESEPLQVLAVHTKFSTLFIGEKIIKDLLISLN